MSDTRGCFKLVGLGFGTVIGAGVLYALWMEPTARLVALGIGMFVLGGGLIGLALLYNTKSVARSVAEALKGPEQDRRSYHVGSSANGGREWVEGKVSGYGLPPAPPRGLLGSGKDGDSGEGDEDFVA